jgi:hypothetical protein
MIAQSTIRRKPRFTYKSPSANVPLSLRIEGTIGASAVAATTSPSTSSGTSANNNSKLVTRLRTHPASRMALPKMAGAASEAIRVVLSKPHRIKYPMGPPLPLYHPLGPLALSLPDLDPTTLGLPAPPASESANRRSSARARRPTTKVRDANAEEDATISFNATVNGIGIQKNVNPPASTSTSASAEPPSGKEKPSPRKRRGGGGGAKRKRKDADEDATYPAKRPRNPRRAAAGDAASRRGESVSPGEDGAERPQQQQDESEEKEKQPERRTTRSRGTLRRRDSTGSEATATSVSVITVAVSAKDDAKHVPGVNLGDVEDPADGRESQELGNDGMEKRTFGQNKENREQGEVRESSSPRKEKE